MGFLVPQITQPQSGYARLEGRHLMPGPRRGATCTAFLELNIGQELSLCDTDMTPKLSCLT